MRNLYEYWEEYMSLKGELFGDSPFVILDDADPKTTRYNQLFQFFHPEFRTQDWKSPSEEYINMIRIKNFVYRMKR